MTLAILCTSLANSSHIPTMALTMSMFIPSPPILKNLKLANPTTPISPADPLSTKPDPKLSSSLSATWRTIQGSDNWQHLVDPLDPLLRSELIRYGQLASACYKAFDLNPSSKRYLNCKHGKKSLFKSVGMENTGYGITKYVYATPDITIPTQPATCCSRWIGYIAISSNEEVHRLGRRDIVVSFRGTVTSTEWIANLMSSLTPARLDPNNPQCEVKVESGFLSLYTSDDSTSKFSQGSCREQLLSEVSRIVHEYRDEEMSITLVGHSMGSSLAILLGYDLAELGLNRDASKREIPITVYSFGGPRVGNLVFKRRCEELGVKVLRVVNANDPVTKMPGVVLNEWCRIWGGRYCYAHVGVELGLDFFKMGDPIWVHDLDAYLLGLNNYCGCDKVVEVKKKKKEEEEDINVMGKARDNQLNNNIINVSSNNKHGNRIWPWKFAARQVGDLVQSLGF